MSGPRVLLSFPTRLGTTGIGMIAWHQATGLSRLGLEVRVATGSSERPMPGVDVALESMKLGPARLPYRAVGLARAAAYHDARTARLLRSLKGRIDVVHAWPLGAERTLRAARELNIPALLERPNAHTAFAFAAVRDESARIGVPIDPTSPHVGDPKRLAREEREYAVATALLCPSDFVASTHRDKGTLPERLLRTQYGYDPARFPAPAPRPAKRPFTVVFVGRVEPRKGLHTALEAWHAAGLGDAGGRFKICGKVDQGYDTVLAPLLAHSSVEALGHHPDPGAVMRDADVFVLPSVEEGSALVTYEARASGCVLAVSDHSGAQCTDGVDALVHRAGDVEALTGHLRLLASDSELLARMRATSLDGVADLTWDAAARQLLGAYEIALRPS